MTGERREKTERPGTEPARPAGLGGSRHPDLGLPASGREEGRLRCRGPTSWHFATQQ